MTSEERIWTRLRDEAQGLLRADFASHVVRRAQNQRKLARREYLLIAITAGACLLSVTAGNWFLGNQSQGRNLALWKVSEAQIRALRTSI